ncbi:MAG: imidazole glycerol phosphate synthase subunit HisH [Rhodothermales bacterium]|nr:imidazole glycerol phosphate synthase subunit HisH [Rhodothermales bacterium]
MIAIVDYGMGNAGSIQNMLLRLGQRSVITNDHDAIRAADKLILPGVGTFDQAVQNLDERGLRDVLHERVLEERIPILGICLGMQLFTQRSEEGGAAEGLGWFKADTRRFVFPAERPLRLPHMGWNTLHVERPHPVLDNLADEARFYFVHTYHVVCHRSEDILARARYGIPFTAMIARDNIVGAQFHPEKSHRFGLALMSRFAAL